MTKSKKTEADHIAEARQKLLEAALPEVLFDGWGEPVFKAAIASSGIDPHLAHLACPRGSVDLAVAYHRAGDATMIAAVEAADLSAMRYRDKVAFCVRARLETADKDVVRRGVAFFALPQNAGEGTAAIWGTADAIWSALGDTSEDVNWYTKRTILSAVYSATVLFWLGDTSEGDKDTWAFLDRRIENVMQFEKLKAQANKVPFVKAFMNGPGRVLDRVRKPSATPPSDLPGSMR